jgi:hypothetical protein
MSFSSQPYSWEMEWAYDGGKRAKWGILMQFSQQGCKCLGKGGDVKWAEFHYSYA